MKQLIAAVFLVNVLYGTENSPWIEPVLEPVLKLDIGEQFFNQIQSGSHACHYPGRDLMINTGLFFALSTDVSFEVETRFTKTHQHGFALDQVTETCRYAIWDDARGDPLALTLGIQLREPISFGLGDPSFIHHALFETELHVATGREWTLESERTGSIYGLAAFGLGTRGSPWARGQLSAAYNFCQEHSLQANFFAQTGFGKNNFHFHHFHGYGSIAYRLIDASLEYSYNDEDFEISIEYLHSLYRRNCQTNVQQIFFHLSYPFNL